MTPVSTAVRVSAETPIDVLDRHIIAATQAGLPLVARPYAAIAQRLGIDPAEVMARMRRMIADGRIRRIAAVPNHYVLGFTANGMSVWDVADGEARDWGRKIGALDFVSHCYLRPRHPPIWSFNLFAMVHGRDRREVEEHVEEIARLLGAADRGHEVLYSTRILKKTGLRFNMNQHLPSSPSLLPEREGSRTPSPLGRGGGVRDFEDRF